jgi:AcrR family transcriptional regulator
MATPTRQPPAKQRSDRRTRAARAERRDAREALLDAALEVFAERGLKDASIDEIAERAGYSKGAVYWHFASKDDLFFALLDERIDRQVREAIDMLESAPAEHDMAPEGNRVFEALLRGQRELLILDHEYWAQAIRDPALRRRYARRQAELRSAWAKALVARLEHLGAPPIDTPPEEISTVLLALARGLSQEKLISPRAVPEHLLGDAYAWIYAGLVARALAGGD